MSIKDILLSYGITSIYHFTDKSNLSSIEKYGIQSLKNIITKNISVNRFGADTLSHNLDKYKGLDKYVHLSFIKDHPMYYVAKERGSIIEPVWIELDISVLFKTNTLFSDSIANRNNANIFKLDEIFNFIDFKTMLHSNDFYLKKEARKAEIMAYESISLNKILGVTYGK